MINSDINAMYCHERGKCRQILLFIKVGLSPSKNLVLIASMKYAFYFIFKVLFVLKIKGTKGNLRGQSPPPKKDFLISLRRLNGLQWH